MSGTPLTKPLHNGSVETGPGVSCMGSRWGSTGLTAMWSLSWPLGLAVGVGAPFAIRSGMPWLLSHQSGPLVQGFNQSFSASLAPIVWMRVGECWLAAFASFVGSYKRCKRFNTRTTLESLVGRQRRRQFEIPLGESFRRQEYAME